MSLKQKIDEALGLLRRASQDFDPAVMASSLGAEDMVLTDLIWKNELPVAIFTLDTGRLPEATYRLLSLVRDHYGRDIRVYFPKSEDVEQVVSRYGINGFYHDVEGRKACCRARKVTVLRRALQNRRSWITGLRREQSSTRQSAQAVSWDEEHGLVKFSPLVEWTRDDVWEYLRSNNVPYNALHDQGYASIGCAPCTRAVLEGEDERAGRWWWEHSETRECGLHLSKASA